MTTTKTQPKPRKAAIPKPTPDPEQLRAMASQLLTWANAAEAGR